MHVKQPLQPAKPNCPALKIKQGPRWQNLNSARTSVTEDMWGHFLLCYGPLHSWNYWTDVLSSDSSSVNCLSLFLPSSNISIWQLCLRCHVLLNMQLIDNVIHSLQFPRPGTHISCTVIFSQSYYGLLVIWDWYIVYLLHYLSSALIAASLSKTLHMFLLNSHCLSLTFHICWPFTFHF